MQQSTPAPKRARPLISALGWLGIILWVAAAIVLFVLLGNFQLKAPLPGSRIPLGAGLNALAQIVMIAALLLGWRFARANDFRKHRRVQTTVVLVNWLMILFVMGVTYFGPEVMSNPKGMSDPVVLLEIGHGIAGSLAALSGGYLVFRMVFERALPDWIKVRNFKRLMQITIVFWLLIAAGGLAIFAVKYLLPSSAATPIVASPAPTAPPVAADTATPSPLPPAPTPTPAEVFGIASVVDERAESDRINIDLINVPPPPVRSMYVAWLIGNNGEFRLPIGALPPGTAGRVTYAFTSPIGGNLLAKYDEFVVTLEQASDLDTQPSSDIRFSAVIPAGARPALRALLVSGGDTPGEVGYLVGLRRQAQLVVEHVSLTDLSTGSQDLAGIHRHAEHLVNLIEGLHGANFGDVDGDGRLLNPGDGYGLLSTDQGFGYVEAARVHAQAALEAPDATAQIKFHAEHVTIGAANAQAWAEQLHARSLELARASDVATAQRILDEMRPLAAALLDGVDANGNGSVEPIPGEGAVNMAYTHAQFAASPAYQSALLEGGAPIVVPEATPTATATPAPSVVQVLMKDFVFAPQTITIKAGMTIQFVNLDNAPHTATLDDDSKDTGTLNLNDVAALTFDAPGEFPYFCLFHGGPGGVGMAGKIVVEP